MMLSMKRIGSLLLALVLCVSMAACGRKEEGNGSSSGASSAPSGSGAPSQKLEGTVAKINLGADPKTLDPSLNSASDGNNVITNTFEGLLRDFGNGPEPATAEHYAVSDDGLTWTFTLREGAKWSDGQPVRAQDYVFSWRRTVDPKTASEYAYFLYPIQNAQEITKGEKPAEELGVRALDERTLEVTLAGPCDYFEELVCFPTLAPEREDVVDESGLWAKDPKKAVSNGPFYLTDYKLGSHLVLSKNPYYWDAENTKLDHVLCRMIVDASTILTSFKAGEIQWTDKAPTEEIPGLIASGELEVLPYISTYFYVINQNTPVEALKDVRVRKAISMAIDRQAICDMVTRGGQTPAMGYIPPGLTDDQGRDFRETAGDYYLAPTAQAAQAQALLAEAGYPNGEGIGTLEILYNTDDKHKAIAEAVQEMLKQNLGLSVKLVNQEWAVFQDTRNSGNYQALARHGWTGDYRDPQTFLDMFMTVGGAPNPQSGNMYQNEAFDALMEKALASTGAERYDAFYQAEELLMEDGYIIPIQYNVQTVLSSPKLTGWYLSSIGKLYLGRAQLEE